MLDDVSETFYQTFYTCVAWISSNRSAIMAITMFTLQGIYLVCKIIESIRDNSGKRSGNKSLIWGSL